MSYPCARPLRIARVSRRIESPWQTTRVFPGGLVSRAEASERIFGTLPPADGLTFVSGAGSGQYEARSMWASATVGRSTAAATATPVNSLNRTPLRTGPHLHRIDHCEFPAEKRRESNRLGRALRR